MNHMKTYSCLISSVVGTWKLQVEIRDTTGNWDKSLSHSLDGEVSTKPMLPALPPPPLFPHQPCLTEKSMLPVLNCRNLTLSIMLSSGLFLLI